MRNKIEQVAQNPPNHVVAKALEMYMALLVTAIIFIASDRGVGLVKIFPLSEAAVNKHLKWGRHLKPKDKTDAEL